MADDEYTPTEARVCIDFCNAAVQRKGTHTPLSMEEADAAFTRFMESVRAEERERIARAIEAEEPKIRGYVDFDRHKEDCIGQINGLRRAARIAREEA